MVDGINKLGAVNDIKAAGVQASTTDDVKLGGFGYGYKTSEGTGITVERKIPGLEELQTKFESVEIPKYCKNIAQLSIADNDYILDGVFQEQEFCEA